MSSLPFPTCEATDYEIELERLVAQVLYAGAVIPNRIYVGEPFYQILVGHTIGKRLPRAKSKCLALKR